MHAIDVIRRNHFHHSPYQHVLTELFHDNTLPEENANPEGMEIGGIFIEISHGPMHGGGSMLDHCEETISITVNERPEKLPSRRQAHRTMAWQGDGFMTVLHAEPEIP